MSTRKHRKLRRDVDTILAKEAEFAALATGVSTIIRKAANQIRRKARPPAKPK